MTGDVEEAELGASAVQVSGDVAEIRIASVRGADIYDG
jgi:hypothetical protein